MTPPAGAPAVSGLRRALAVVAALYGAVGVGLLAAGAHMPGGEWLTTAGSMLLFHAPVLLALRLWPGAPGRTADAAALLIALGVALFAADLVLRVFLGRGLFPMAAPTGGTATMLGWLALALHAGLARDRD